MRLIRGIAVLTIVSVLLTACGRKGELIIPGTVLPAGVTDLRATQGEASVVLAFTKPDKNTAGNPLTDLAGFTIWRGEMEEHGCCSSKFEKVGSIDLEYPKAARISGRRITWDDSSAVAAGNTYVYKVIGVNRDGYDGRQSNEAKVRALPLPAAPSGLAAKPGNARVSLTWSSVGADRTGAPVTDIAGYNVYRSDKSGEYGVPSNTVPVKETAYRDAGLENGASYYYRVTALRGPESPYTEGALSEEVSAVPADTAPPAAPAGLRAVPAQGMVMLSWDVNAEPDVKGYIVYRRAEGEAEYTRLTAQPTDRITYRDQSAAPGFKYLYAVTAVDAAGNESEKSGTQTVMMEK